MVITTTAIGFIILSLGLAVCGWRFFSAVKRSGNLVEGKKIGKLLSWFYFGFAVQNGIIGIASLLFVHNLKLVTFSLSISNLVLSFVTILGVYLIFYLFFPKISPLPASIAIFIYGIVVTVASFIIPQSPSITSAGGLDFGMPNNLSILLYYLLIIAIGSEFFIFLKIFKANKVQAIRNNAFILFLLAFIGIINVSIRLIATGLNESRIQVFDYITVIIGAVFISIPLLILFKQRLFKGVFYEK